MEECSVNVMRRYIVFTLICTDHCYFVVAIYIIIVCVLRDSGLSHVKVIPFLLSDEQRDCLIQTHFHTSSGVSYVHDILCYWPPECSAPGQNVFPFS